jgi:class 3 adenylate cyclase
VKPEATRSRIDALASFLPSLAVAHAQSGEPSCRSRELRGAVLFADIAGFTALTERLAASGPEGAEELTRQLNRAFGELTELVAERGGDTVKFAGDGLLALWVADGDRDLPHTVACAAHCALAIQQRVQQSEVGKALGLSLRLAVGAGRVAVATIGGMNERWELLVAGEALVQVGRASQLGSPGAVLIAPEAAPWLERAHARTRAHPGGTLLLELTSAPQPPPRSERQVPAGILPTLRALIPRAIRNPLDAGLSEWIGELRELTILFIGLPELALLEPGSLERAQSAFIALQQSLYRYEGSVNKLNADDKGVSVLAVLGLPPLAHDDDAERGVRAALGVRRELGRLGLRCGIGVASGRAFCGAVGGERRREYTIMGDVVNLAARLMGAAGDGIYCDSTTAQRAAGLRFEALPPIRLKGKREAVAIHRPLEAGLEPRATPAPGSAASTLVGRAPELRRAERWIERLAGGTPLRACISGPAGSGKSALLARALEAARARGVVLLRSAAHAFERATPYHAWRPLLFELLELGAAPPDAAARRAHLRARLPAAELDADLPLLAEAIGIDLAAAAGGDGDEDPRQRALRTRRLVCRIVADACARGALLIAIEDVQWLDAASRALVLEVARTVPAAGLLLCARSEDSAHADLLEGLRAAGALDVLELRELGRRAVLELVRERLQVRALPRALAESLCARAGGNPLFAETLAWALRDSGLLEIAGGRCRVRDARAQSGELPRTLQAALTRRIDALDADVQLTLKLASVIGQELELDALSAIHPLAPSLSDLTAQCALLERLEWIVREGPQDAGESATRWRFRSGVAREVTYGLMLFSQRRRVHMALAQFYETRREAVPLALLAHHWRCAADGKDRDRALVERAADALAAAAHQAARSDASQDAIHLYRQALDLARRLPADAAAARRELGLLLELGLPLVRATSWASLDVGEAYRRAAELGAEVGDELQRFQALRGLWQFHTGHGEYARARALEDELLELAERANRGGLLLETHRMLGNTAFWSGELAQAQARLQAAVELAARDTRTDPPLLSAYGQDPEVANRGILAWVLCLLGRSEEALAEAERAVQRAQSLDHPFTLAFASGSCMWTYAFLRRAPDAEQWARRTLELSRRRGFAYLETAASVVLGWARTVQGNARGGLREIERALARWRAGGQTIGTLAFALMLADAYLSAQRVDDAREILADPQLCARGAAEGWLEPLLRCLHAQILLADGAPGAADALREVLRFAEERGALLIAGRARDLIEGSAGSLSDPPPRAAARPARP